MSWSAAAFAGIAEDITREFGISFPPVRRPFAESAMRRALRLAHECDAARYRERLVTEPELLRTLIAEVTVGETYFFRDSLQFEVLRALVLTEIAQRRRDLPLRVWSAGCSTGEEAYSLAILLDECGFRERGRVFATDVSSAAIDAARGAHYGAWSFRGESADRRQRCFTRSGARWTVAPAYRCVDFAVRNLLAPLPPNADGTFDVILCRNVLLYFDPPTVERAARRLFDALAPGGWLVLSPTDPPLPGDLGFEGVVTPAGLIFRRPLPHADHVAPQLVAPRMPERAVMRPPAVDAPPGITTPAEAEDHVVRALAMLDASRPHEAAAAARRALFLDRSFALAHLTLGRALRLTGQRAGAQRALHRSAALLEAHAPEDCVRGAGGASAGTLSAVAAAEFDLLVRQPT